MAFWLVGIRKEGEEATNNDAGYNFCVDDISDDMPGEVAPIDHFRRGLAMPQEDLLEQMEEKRRMQLKFKEEEGSVSHKEDERKSA